MKIKNSDALGSTPLRKAALEILESGLSAIDTEKVVRDLISLSGETLRIGGEDFPLQNYHKIFLAGVGKCALNASRVVEDILGDHLSGGVVIDVEPGQLKRCQVFKGDHPTPTIHNVAASQALYDLCKNAGENDLVIFMISGGGSALLCLPTEGNSPEMETQVFKTLTAHGADIEEMNTVRKHLSLARGGGLAEAAYPARSVALLFSDVPGHRPEIISSGPTMLDETSVSDAKKVLKKYKAEIPDEVLRETDKDPEHFKKVKNILAVSNETALRAMSITAEKLGFRAKIESFSESGEARKVGESVAKALEKSEPNTALLWGGETTVVIEGDGIGGRNQELVLSALSYIGQNELIIGSSSDGRDNTQAAGAICDIITLSHAKKLGLVPGDFLARNDSYTFFEKCGDQIITGPTGSNVADFIIALNAKEEPESQNQT